MRSIFVTGTDTDAGKTWVTGGIAAELRRRGLDCLPAKPVQTGCVNGNAPDLDSALSLCGAVVSRELNEQLCPVRFSAPCSPDLAAELAGASIDFQKLVSSLRELASTRSLIAEGAGGILVPLGGGRTMLDLMRELGWPVVLVVRNRLGCINHSLLSLRILKAAGLEVAGVVMNQADPPEEPVSSANVRAIEEYGGFPVIGRIPFSPDGVTVEMFRETADRLERFLK